MPGLGQTGGLLAWKLWAPHQGAGGVGSGRCGQADKERGGDLSDHIAGLQRAAGLAGLADNMRAPTPGMALDSSILAQKGLTNRGLRPLPFHLLPFQALCLQKLLVREGQGPWTKQ